MKTSQRKWVSILNIPTIPLASETISENAAPNDNSGKVSLPSSLVPGHVSQSALVNSSPGNDPAVMKSETNNTTSSNLPLKIEDAKASEDDTGEVAFICNNSGVVLPSEESLSQHQSTHGYQNEVLNCDLCCKMMDMNYSDHIKDLHAHLDLRCEADRTNNCQSHQAHLKERRQLKCDRCQMAFTNSITFQSHVKFAHIERSDESKRPPVVREIRKRKCATPSTVKGRKKVRPGLQLVVNLDVGTRSSLSLAKDESDLTNHTLSTIKSQNERIQLLLLDLKTICEGLEELGNDVLVLMVEDTACQWWGSSVAKECLSQEDKFVQRFMNHCREKREKTEDPKKGSSRWKYRPKSDNNLKVTNPKDRLKLVNKLKTTTKKPKANSVVREKLKNESPIPEETNDSMNKDKTFALSAEANNQNENADRNKTKAYVLDPKTDDIDNEPALVEALVENDTNDAYLTDDADDNSVPADDLIFKDIFPDNQCKFCCEKCEAAFLTESQLLSHRNFHPDCVSEKSMKGLTRSALLQETVVYTDPDLGVEITTTIESLLQSQNMAPFKCLVCQALISRHRGLFRHLLTHKTDLLFACIICSKRFRCTRTYQNHMKLHAKRPYSCIICEKGFRGEQDISRHKSPDGLCLKDQASIEIIDQLVCYVCTFTTSNSNEFESHAKVHIEREETECIACNKSFPLLHDFVEHMKLEQNQPNPFLCVCGKTFKSTAAYNRHKKLHEDPKLQCQMCDRKFHDRSNLRAHERAHDGVKPYVCDFCGASYRKKVYFENHRRLHTGDRPYKCDIEGCEKTFRGLQSLNQHQRTHCKIGSYICDICGRTFKQSGLLSYHRKSHTIEWRWPCDYCPEKFKTIWTYKRHLANNHADKKNEIESTSNIKLHECTICKKIYHDHEDMRRHMNNHNGVKPFSCEFCNKSFSDRSNLLNHKYIHSGRKKLKCAHCYKTFVQQGNLNAHMDKQHPEEALGQCSKTSQVIQEASTTDLQHVFI